MQNNAINGLCAKKIVWKLGDSKENKNKHQLTLRMVNETALIPYDDAIASNMVRH